MKQNEREGQKRDEWEIMPMSEEQSNFLAGQTEYLGKQLQ